MNKKLLIAILVFLVYLVVVWVGALLFLKGSNLVLVGVVLSVCGLTLLLVYLLVTKLAPGGMAGQAAAAGGVAMPQMPEMPQLAGRDPDSDALAGLIREANELLGRSPKLASQRVKSTLGDFPLYFVVGSEGSGKTSTFLGSRREPELLSGQISRDSTVAPTRLVNIFFTDGSIVVEAGGGYFSGDAGRWGRMIAAFRRGGNEGLLARLFGGSKSSNLGGVVLCCDTSAFLGVPDNNKLNAMARQAQQRLRAVAAQFGGDVPVYVIFTKADGIPYFGDYFARVPEAEDQQIVGCTRYLAGGPASAAGVYGEAETARITAALNKVYYSLADWRLAVLERETDRTRKPNIYEFPREMKKIRSPLVQFLVDVFRPDPLQFNAVLEGVYFTGTRKVAASPASGAGGPSAGAGGGLALDRSVVFKVGDVTRMMRVEEMQQQFRQPESGGRAPEITRWAFTADVWQQILRPQPTAHTPVYINRKDQFYRKMIFVALSAVGTLAALLFLTSFLLNRSLVNDVQEAAVQCEPLPAASGAAPAPTEAQLQHIDALRTKLEDLSSHGSGFFKDWGLYQGKRLIDPAETVYFTRFREYFLNGIVARLGSELSSLPSAPVQASPYDAIYGDLKTYRTITHSPAEASCAADDPLATRLLALWRTGQTPTPEAENIARASFQYYVQSLKAHRVPEELAIASNDDLVVRRGRDYLGSFKGIEPRYHRLIEQANLELHGSVRLQDLTHNTGYRKAMAVEEEVPAAFTRAGWDKMQQLIENAGSMKGAESCVLGSGAQAGGAAPAGDDVKAQLRQMYAKDYIQQWNDYLAKASVRPYEGCGDAAEKLGQFSGNTSPILAVLMLADQNTNLPPHAPAQQGAAAPEDAISGAFQPVSAVEGPPNPDRWQTPQNMPYLEALGNLQRSIQALDHGGQCDVTNQAGNAQATSDLNLAQAAVDKLALNFNIGPASESVKGLLQQPLTAARRIIITDPSAVAKGKINGAQGALCKALAGLSRKYPFNASSEDDASVEEVTRIFSAADGPLGTVRAAVADQVVKTGGTYALKPDAAVKLTHTFIDFLNKVSLISDALFAKPGTPPAMRYRLTVRPNPGIKQVTGKIDGQAAAMASTEYEWPMSNPGLDLRVEQTAGGSTPLRSFSGVWAIFRLLSDAVHTPGSDQFSLINVQGGRGSRAQPILEDGSAIVLEVTQYPNGVRQAFDRNFFQLSCPGKAAE